MCNGTISYDTRPVIMPLRGGEDSAFNELLEGRMDLDIILPDDRKIHMSVDRRTPMMDLLVKVTTPNKIKPGGHIIQVYDDRGRDLPYKPSTPIGSMDACTVHIVPKKLRTENEKLKFEQTLRLQVRLPYNQRSAYRFSPNKTLGEIKQVVCKDKNLDPKVHLLVHPQNQDKVLDVKMTFGDYNRKEISLLLIKCIDPKSSHVETIPYQSHELQEKKKRGVVSSERGDDQDGMDLAGHGVKSHVKARSKKQLAPLPPSLKETKNEVLSSRKPFSKIDRHDKGSVSYSYRSSSSSGYHESSVFSQSLVGNTCSKVAHSSTENISFKNRNFTSKNKLCIDRFSLTKANSSTLSGRKKRAPLPPSKQTIEKRAIEHAEEEKRDDPNKPSLVKVLESHTTEKEGSAEHVNATETDVSTTSQVNGSSETSEYYVENINASFAGDKEQCFSSNSLIPCSDTDGKEETMRSSTPAIEDENLYPSELYSELDNDKNSRSRKNSGQYSVIHSDADELNLDPFRERLEQMLQKHIDIYL
ncbi:cordon-bleu protein-like 1 [Limulus polyphemus]|uniref:Cordon-bleu protein-like 1 n=1 Tax=Limulus polyphemus TaxID=6850 RepID=A0ABM1BGD5_LIMPO|nr:cordon-bleu protein-like 1 [Limulus polyphemus]XP_022249923.1 cordon-bleu protein-like 1 [Limulus polyphemus]XP_022249929.1 cordon-bleu protein-like 1 [Limulus polyphemus]